MVKAEDFLAICKKNNINYFSGTPCSYLKPLINAVIDDKDVDYIDATNEGDAVAIVCGAYLSGKLGVVMFQNSGLGNAINSLTSLAFPFRFPFLVIVTHRGQPGGPADEPQHELMGKITEEMLDTLRIPWSYLPESQEKLDAVLSTALDYMKNQQLPYALIMHKGTVEKYELKTKKLETPIGKRSIELKENISKAYSQRHSRFEALSLINSKRGLNNIFIVTTGKSGRELYTLEDRPDNLYMVGSMGCASSFTLGAALNFPDYKWTVIDGDAAALMRMGNLATIGYRHPENLMHIILDNEVNDSTGGQSTVSSNVSLAGVALACGYADAYSTDEIEELEAILDKTVNLKGPILIHFRIKKGSLEELGRPKIKPFEVKDRLIRHLNQS